MMRVNEQSIEQRAAAACSGGSLQGKGRGGTLGEEMERRQQAARERLWYYSIVVAIDGWCVARCGGAGGLL